MFESEIGCTLIEQVAMLPPGSADGLNETITLPVPSAPRSSVCPSMTMPAIWSR